jgi:2-amino-4-hydroxy-6-hydroxymethyldihydropteridine diphosphokinase
MPLAYILLGSNLGDKQNYLSNATTLINNTVGEVVKKSSIYETEAWGVIAQPSYLNQVIIVNTLAKPLQLLESLLSIEQQLGRKRSEKYASRTIDIDILFYGREIVDLPQLKIPHPHIQDRKFVLTPLCELVPSKLHPTMHLPLKQLLLQCTDLLPVHKIETLD